MKVHTKNGELKVNNYVFLPTLEQSEFVSEEEDITSAEIVVDSSSSLEQYLAPGRYIQITAPVLVTRYFRLEN